MTYFFSRLSYSFGNEDPTTDNKALRIEPGDRVLCITASGDRPLNLLVNDCEEIVSVDLNPYQNYLLNLKMTAMRHFDFDNYLAFLGAIPGFGKEECLEKIVPHMEHKAACYWLQNQEKIYKGILYQGAAERITRIVSFFLRIFRRKKLKKLFEINDIVEQQNFVKTEWETKAWKKAFDCFLNPWISRWLIRDPGLYSNIGNSITPSEYLHQRLNHSLNKHLAKENLLVSLMLKGKVGKEAFPPYLTQEGVSIIKKRLDRISYHTKDIISFLESEPDNSYDCFSLSDVASYLKEEDFQRLLRAVYRTAKQGARFSIRQFLSSHTFPRDLLTHFVREERLEKELEDEDKCFVYRYIVGSINKG